VSTSIGLVGLPNVGKTTVFNALTAAGAPAHNYPFCTIHRNVAAVPVPDARLEALASLLSPEEVKPTTIEVIDIAGLVKGANTGEGLGNRFLDDIRNVDAIFHVVRCFEGLSVARAGGSSGPVADLHLVDTELMLADLEIVARKMEQLAKKAKASSGGTSRELEVFQAVIAQLQAGRAPSMAEFTSQERLMVEQERLLSLKPCVIVANGSEDIIDHQGEDLQALSTAAAPRRVVPFPGGIEADLVGMDADGRALFFREFGLGGSHVPALLREGFDLLGLIAFYTVAHNKLHAWRIRRGRTALDAAGLIHSDIAEGFIRADVCAAEDLIQHGSVAALRSVGRLRSEGRDYEIGDGDVLYVHFQPRHG